MARSAFDWWLDHLWNVDSFEVTADHLALLALQIALEIGAVEHGGLKPGRYVRDDAPARWRPAD